MQQRSILVCCAALVSLLSPAIALEAAWKKVRTTAWEDIYIDSDSLRDTSLGKMVGVIEALKSSAGQASPDVRFVEEIQCQGWRHRTLSINGHYLPSKTQQWAPIARESIAEAVAQAICAGQDDSSRSF